MRVVSWNMGGMTRTLQDSETRRKAWEKLVDLRRPADIALLQEATFPYDDWGIQPEVPLGFGRRAASRIWSRSFKLIDPKPLEDVWDHGYVMTAKVALTDRELNLISLHARTEPLVVENIEALLERLRSWMSEGSFILGGDFNSCRIEAEASWPEGGHREFFERVEADYGVYNCYWNEHQSEPRTYWPNCEEVGRPYQDDHIFVSEDLKGLVTSEVLDYEPFRGLSDHTPIAIDVDLD